MDNIVLYRSRSEGLPSFNSIGLSAGGEAGSPPYARNARTPKSYSKRAAGVVLLFYPVPSLYSQFSYHRCFRSTLSLARMNIAQMLQDPIQDTHTHAGRTYQNPTPSTSSSPMSTLHTTSSVAKTPRTRRRQTKVACLGCRQRKSKVGSSTLQVLKHAPHTSKRRPPLSIDSY